MTDPGWYADPSGRNETYRWWDGTSWTRWLSEVPDAPDPDDAVPDESVPDEVAAGDAYIPQDHDQPAIRLPLAVGITIGAVILSVILLGAAVSFTSDRLPTGPAVDPPAPGDQPIVAMFDATKQEYVAGPIRMKLLGAPYDCRDSAGSLRSGSPNGFSCSVVIHENYKEMHSWHADTGFGVLPDSMVVPDDLKGTARKVLGQLGSNGYEGVKLIDPEFKAEPLTGITNAPDEAMQVTGTMGYRVPNLPATKTYLTFIVIKLAESGKHVVFYTDYPNTAPKGVKEASDAALKTLTAR